MLIIILVVLLFNISYGKKCEETKDFYYDAERGWYYFEECDVKEKKEKKETKKPEHKKKTEKKPKEPEILKDRTVKIPWEIIDKLPQKKLQEIEEQARYISTINPTKENLKEYLKLLIFFKKLSERKTKLAKELLKTDPELIALDSYKPVYGFERDIFYNIQEDKKDKIIKNFKEKALLVMIAKKTCPYCRKQKQILREFSRETGWKVKIVYIEDNPNLARMLKSTRVPDLFIFMKKGNTPLWQRISAGLTPKSSIKDSILLGLKLLGEIKDENNNPDFNSSFIIK